MWFVIRTMSLGKPVWGTPAVPYSNDVLAHMRQTLMLALRGQGDMPFDWRMD